MGVSLFDQLVGVSSDQLALLRKLKELGAAGADELAVKLNRAGDDLTPEIENLVKRNLLEVRTLKVGEEEFQVYLTSSAIRSLL